MLEVVILNRQVLVLMEQVVDLELQLRSTNILTTELILKLYQFVLKFNPHLALIIEVMLVLLPSLFELFSLVF